MIWKNSWNKGRKLFNIIVILNVSECIVLKYVTCVVRNHTNTNLMIIILTIIFNLYIKNDRIRVSLGKIDENIIRNFGLFTK